MKEVDPTSERHGNSSPSATPTVSSGAPTPEITIRVLKPDDAEAVRRLHERLSDSDRYRRFCGPGPKRVETLATLICQRDAGYYALGAFEDDTLVGVAHYVVVDRRRGHRTAEFALVVDGHEQRHGIGTILLRRLCMDAYTHGLDHLTAQILAENNLMLAVIAEQGLADALHPEGAVVYFDLDLHRRGN